MMRIDDTRTTIATVSIKSTTTRQPHYWWPNPTQIMTRMVSTRTTIATVTIRLTMTRISWSVWQTC